MKKAKLKRANSEKKWVMAQIGRQAYAEKIFKALDIEIKVQHSYPAARYNPDSLYGKKMKEAKKLVQGYSDSDFTRYGIAGSTDMAFVQEVLNTEDIVMVGAGRSGNNIHGVDEYAHISDLKALVKELIYYLCY